MNDSDYLYVAYQAATHSCDPRTQNGAIFVNKNGEIVCAAYNDFPDRVVNTPDRLINPTKGLYLEHAERNLIYKAYRQDIPINGLTMYVCWAACHDCARAIIGVGIRKIVTHKAMLDNTPDHWKKNVDSALDMLREAGVTISIYDGPIGGVETRFNGERWRP